MDDRDQGGGDREREPTFDELIAGQGEATPEQIARALAGDQWRELLAALARGCRHRSVGETTGHSELPGDDEDC